MKNKRLVALTLAGMMGLTSLAGATTAFAASDSDTVAAPTNATGSVYVSIEKSAAYKKDASTIDYVLAPVKVNLADVATAMGGTDALTPDDGITDITILDVLKTAYGQNNFTATYNAGYNCYYISSIKDSGDTTNYVASQSDYLYGTQVASLSTQYSLNTTFDGKIAKTGWLTENDLVKNGGSGWLIAQNNVGPYYGVSTKVANGDTLRMEWSTFNGMDVGYAGYLGSNWTQVAPFIYASSSVGDYGTDYVKVNKDALVKWLPDNTSAATAKITLANNTLKNVQVKQTVVDTVVNQLK